MRKNGVTQRKVLVALWMNGAPGRTQLTGVFRFANKRGWNIRILQNSSELTSAIVRNAEQDGTDGFIVGIRPDNNSAVQTIRKSCLPVVSIDIPDYCHRSNAVLVRNNDFDIGMLGARHLLSLGNFNSFAFVSDLRNRQWSADRLSGFTEQLARHNRSPNVFFSPVSGTDIDRTSDMIALAQWLARLPKPAAVMAAWDNRATNVIEACRSARLKIPEQIALLGIDDDELLCENAVPPLSSIRPNFEEEGFKAAEALDALMKGHRPPSVICCATKSITERESTKPIAPSVHLVNRALAFIQTHACKGASISDVVEHLGVSRRLADLRFRQVHGQSIGRAIENQRLAEVKRLLSSTDWSIRRIAAASGYANPNRLSHLFTQRHGMSIREWRMRHLGNV